MKKLLLLTLFVIHSFASGFQIPLPDTNVKSEKKEDKRYSDIISYLKEQNDGESYFYLFSFYLNGSYEPDTEGKVIEKNTELAIEYLEKAIQFNYPYATITLGSLYLYHEDFIIKENNIELAEKYLNLALENDVPEAYTILADIYFNFKEDGAKAVEYLSKGAEANIATSQYALAVIYKNGLNSEAFSLEPNEFIASKYLTDACLNNKKTKKLEELCSSDAVIKEKIGE